MTVRRLPVRALVASVSPRRVLLITLVAGAAAAALWFALLRPSQQAVRASPAHGALLIAPVRRRPLPVVAGSALSPPPARLVVRAAGGPLFLDVWASWCLPCQEEAPMLAALARAYQGRIRFLGIDVEDTRAAARAFERKYRIGYPSIFDRSAALAGRLGFYGLPTAYLVDGRGRIAATLIGKQRRQAIERHFAALLAEPQSR